jgi:SAM-dependent methyltransferase
MPWYFAVAERDHEIQNPTSAERIRLLGERLRLGPDSSVLDIACGKGGPALILAHEFSCRIVGVERAPEFASVARARVSAAGLAHRIEIVERDATELELEPEHYDVAMCLGASFVWDGLDGTLAALTPAARQGGKVVVGEPYWRRWPLRDEIDVGGYFPLYETVGLFESAGLPVETVIASSEDDWDRYETLHWRAFEEWLAENPDDPDAPDIRRRYRTNRDDYLRWQRELLGWAIFVGRKN